MLLRTLELIPLSIFAGFSVIAQTAATPPSWLFQGGALAIVAFMVAQNYRQQREATKANLSMSEALNRIAKCCEAHCIGKEVK